MNSLLNFFSDIFFENLNLFKNTSFLLCGFIAGFINTIAGSGSIFTLGIMLFLNIPANIANGTNRIGLLMHGFTNFITFKKNKQLNLNGAIIFIIPSFIGAIIGSYFGVLFSAYVMKIIIGCSMIFILIIFYFKKNIKKKIKKITLNTFIISILFFFLGLYGGLIQMGIGIIMLLSLMITSDLDVVKANGLKNFIVFIYMVPSTFIYIYQNKVNWEIAIYLAIGQIIGAYLSSKMAFKNKNIETTVENVMKIMILLLIIKSFI